MDNDGVTLDGDDHSSKSNDNKKSLMPGFDFCASHEYMLTLLQQGDIEEFKKFVIQKDTDSCTILHSVVLMCSESGYEPIKNMLDLMLKEAPDIVCIKNQKTGSTPLMLACQEAKCSELILRLVEANPDTVTLEDINGNIPLLAFIRNVTVGRKCGEMKLEKCCHIIETLLMHGNNINHKNKANKDALMCLLEQENLYKDHFRSIVKILFKHGTKLVNESGEHVFKYITKFQSILIDVASQYCPEELSKKDKSNKNILDYLLKYKKYGRDTNFYNSDDSYDESCYGYWTCSDEEILKSLKIIFKNKEIIKNGNDLISLATNRKCDYKIIKFLITKTKNIKIEEKLDKVITKYSTNPQNVIELLKLGCNPNAITYNSFSHSYPYNAILNEFVRNYNFPLRTALNARNKGAIIKLIEGGADPLYVIEMMRAWPEKEPFTVFITEDKCQNLLKLVLNSPKLTKTRENSESLTKFCMLLIMQIFVHYNNNKENVKITRENLQLILKKIQSEDLEMKAQISHVYVNDKLYRETFGNLFIGICILSGLRLSSTSLLRNAQEYVTMMFELGYTVIQNQNNIVSPLTVLLTYSDKNSPSEIVLQFMDLLIERGKVNIDSIVFGNVHYLTQGQKKLPKLLIPDALMFALISCNIDIIERLVSHWWGPPIALTTLLEIFLTYGVGGNYHCTEVYQLLQKYGDLPYGTTLLPKVFWIEMKSWKKRMINMFGGDKGVEESSDLASPTSLQELSKYVVRHCLATRALQPGVSLPQLLHQLLPPLLRLVVIH